MENPRGRRLRIQALVFDFDGLILDTETPLFASWNEIFSECGFAVSEADWAEMLGSESDPPTPYELLERHVGRPVDRGALRQRRLAREEALLASEPLLPGVTSILAEAQARRLLAAVASSSEREWVERHLGRFGLRSAFRIVVCAEDVARTKPSPDLYLEAVRRLGVAPGEAIAFEDSQKGAAAARAAGLFCVSVPNRMTRHRRALEADLTVSSLDEIALADLIRVAESRRGAD
ncbi:MAG: HAD family phosphatase [Candidatus Bipolaricaulota bacterium]